MLRTVLLLMASSFLCSRGAWASRWTRGSQLAMRGMKAARVGLDAINRHDFPLLEVQPQEGTKLLYLDSGASSQKPIFVLNAMDEYYRSIHSNVHRGTHTLSIRATEAYEAARNKVQRFVGARKREEIVFTRGATDSINLVAQGWGSRLSPGDEIILSVMEHHSNLVPWQMLAQRTGAVLRFVGLDKEEHLDMKHYHSLLSSKTRLVALSYASNVLGSINPVQEIVATAHDAGALVLLDACQAVPHLSIDVSRLDADFLVASGHKMCGPTGIGFLYGKHEVLSSMSPVQGGGEMIESVHLDHSTYAAPPLRFEAGTPPIAEAVGLGAACDYLSNIGMSRIEDHMQRLSCYLYDKLSAVAELKLLGPSPEVARRIGLVAFAHPRHHSADLVFFLNQEGVAVRGGTHCAQPLHRALNLSGSVRASLGLYNSKEEVDQFVEKLVETIAMLDNI